MITLFRTKIPESSKTHQTVEAFSYQMSLNTWAPNIFILSMSKLDLFFEKYPKQKNP